MSKTKECAAMRVGVQVSLDSKVREILPEEMRAPNKDSPVESGGGPGLRERAEDSRQKVQCEQRPWGRKSLRGSSGESE